MLNNFIILSKSNLAEYSYGSRLEQILAMCVRTVYISITLGQGHDAFLGHGQQL